MPKGVRYGGRKKGTPNKKTVWILESLLEHGYDYEAMLTKFLKQAATGENAAQRMQGERMAYLLVKLVPYLANAPKAERPQVQIETLVIHRHDPAKLPPVSVDTTAVTEGEGDPPSIPESQP